MTKAELSPLRLRNSPAADRMRLLAASVAATVAGGGVSPSGASAAALPRRGVTDAEGSSSLGSRVPVVFFVFFVAPSGSGDDSDAAGGFRKNGVAGPLLPLPLLVLPPPASSFGALEPSSIAASAAAAAAMPLVGSSKTAVSFRAFGGGGSTRR